MSQTSPSPTTFITNLLATLSALCCSYVSTYSTSSAQAPSQASSPPLLLTLPEAAKSIFLTLHVLFPHCLLDALDLLDRGRVIQLTSAYASAVGDAETSQSDDEIRETRLRDKQQTRWFVLSSQTLFNARDENGRGERDGNEGSSRWRQAGGNYGSASRGHATSTRYHSYGQNSTQHAPIMPSDDTGVSGLYDEPRAAGEGERGGSIEGTSYHVHLTAWNCSCPAFAFAAFAGLASSTATTAAPETLHQTGDGENAIRVTASKTEQCHLARSNLDGTLETQWQSRLQNTPSIPSPTSLQFGGLSKSPILSGRRDGVVPPTCKHLLACLLAETCPGLFMPEKGWQQEVTRAGKGKIGVVLRADFGLEEVAAWAGGGVFV